MKMTQRKNLIVALAILAAAFVLRLPAFTRSVLDWDESLYSLMAAQWRAGQLPYTGIWDNKPLGIYAIFAVFQSLFGDGVVALRIASVCFAALAAFAVFGIIRALTQKESAALFGAAAYLMASISNDGLAANTENFMAAFTALAVFTAAAARLNAASGMLTGLLMGAAFMTKYVAVFEDPAILFLLLSRHPRPRVMASVLAGAALPVAAAACLYWHADLLGLWWADSVAANVTRAGAPVSGAALNYIWRVEFWRWGPLFAAAALLLPAGLGRLRGRLRDSRADGQQLFIIIWLVGAGLGVASAKSFYDHYFLQMLPALCVAIGWLTWRLAPFLRHAGPALAVFVLLWLTAGAAQTARAALQPVVFIKNHQLSLRPDEAARIGAALAPSLAASPAAHIYVFDAQPVIYTLVHRPPPTRYALPSVLTTIFLARVADVDPVAEVGRILATRPLFIIRAVHPAATQNVLNPVVYALLAANLAAHYRLWLTDGNTEVYRLG